MNRPQHPLEMLQSLAEERNDDALRRLGASLAAARSAEEQLRLLEAYRAEYRERLARAVSYGLSATEYLNFRLFLVRLDEAIAAQANVVAAQHASVAAGRRHVAATHREVKSYDTLNARREERQRVAEGRREQKLADELATRAFPRFQHS
jgi:flagellar FliJ protein